MRLAPMMMSSIALQAADTAGSTDRLRTTPIALVLAGALALVAVYFLIRLVEWDLINEETPDQEDPLA